MTVTYVEQAELDEERKQKQAAVNAKKKLETDYKDLESTMDIRPFFGGSKGKGKGKPKPAPKAKAAKAEGAAPLAARCCPVLLRLTVASVPQLRRVHGQVRARA